MTWWLAALDTRVKVCVDLCCLTDFDALIAPRPHLALAGNFDLLTPPQGLDRIDEELRRAYADAGAPPDAWRLVRQDVGHQETPEMRREVTAFLRRWL